jgi:hypothetical protein
MRPANLTCSTLLVVVMGVSAIITTAQTGNAPSLPPSPLGKLIDVGVEGIRQVVDVVRTKGKLSGSTQVLDHGLP